MTPVGLDRLAYLAHRALSAPIDNRARMMNTIQLVCRALQTAARAHERIGTADYQQVAAEVAALRRWILEQARAAGLHITADDISQ